MACVESGAYGPAGLSGYLVVTALFQVILGGNKPPSLLDSPPARSATVTPMAMRRSHQRANAALGAAVGVLLSVAMLVLGWLNDDPPPPAVALIAGAGILGALTGYLFGGWPGSLALAEIALSVAHRRRARFIRLLEDATDRQVLRQAGAVYQFRHAELQDHLDRQTTTNAAPARSDRPWRQDSA
jgi:hypothetical protein